MVAPLTSSAQNDPLYSFGNTFQAITREKPLGLSIVSRSIVEVSNQLSAMGYLAEHPPDQLSAKDVRRRVASYNSAFCLPLRRAILQGFCPDLQCQVLQLVEESIPKIPKNRQGAQRTTSRTGSKYRRLTSHKPLLVDTSSNPETAREHLNIEHSTLTPSNLTVDSLLRLLASDSLNSTVKSIHPAPRPHIKSDPSNVNNFLEFFIFPLAVLQSMSFDELPNETILSIF